MAKNNVTNAIALQIPTGINLSEEQRAILEDIANQQAKNEIERIKEHARIARIGQNGENISSYDFTYVQDKYNDKQKELYKASVSATIDFDKETAGKILDAVDKKATEEINKWVADGYNDTHVLFDNILTKVFKNQYNFPPKNLTIPEDANTPQEVVSTLLQNNPGISIGENHTSKVASKFIADNMASFKKDGVDTIYTELDKYTFDHCNNSTVAQLRQELESRTPEDKLKSAQFKVKYYKVDQADDTYSETLRMFIAAKENGIDIVNIDTKRTTQITELARIGITNFIWTQEIAVDRQAKPDGGKFIVYGGIDHFTSSFWQKGMVDDFLGTPVIAFDDRTENMPVLRGHDFSSNAADFYIPSGSCGLDLKKYARIEDLRDEVYKSIFPSTIMRLLEEARALNDSVKLQCSDMSMLEPLTPSYTPSSPTINVPSSALNK